METPLAPEDNGPILGGPGTYGGGAANPANVNLGPFRSMRTAANDNRSFIAPIAGVDLGADQTALLALRRDAAGFGVFKASARGRVSLLNDGVRFIAPADLERRGEELLVADRVAPGGTGGIFSISVDTGEVAAEVLAEGFQPASLTVDALGNVLFSGRDLRTGLPGVFRFEGSGAVETIFSGAPLSDPSGVALKADGTVLVADTSFQGSSVGAIFALQNGAAEVVATGFATGFPAGIALTRDESSVVVSGEGADGFDRLFVVDVASGERSTVQANFSSVQGSSGGLHRLPDSDTFVWSSGSFNGGTVFRLED